MKGSNVHIILATTFFAGLLWLSVSLSDQYQIRVSAPVNVQGIPPGKTIAAPLPQDVKLTFNDYGWRLAKLVWGAQPEWVIDLNQLTTRRQALTIRDFSEQLRNRLGIQPSAMSPESIYISLDTVLTKRVAVVPNFTASFREGYGQIGAAVVEPESIAVSGPQQIVRTLRSWRTQHRLLEQLRQSVDLSLPLEDTAGLLTFVPNRVRLRISIQQLAEKTFAELPVEVLSLPPNREVLLSSPRITVVIRGGIDELARVDQAALRATIEYRMLLADTSGLVEPELTVPAGLRVVRKTPERIQYVIRKKHLL